MTAEAMTLEERDELVTRNPRDLVVDPRSVPVRFSSLKAIDDSPAHYLAAVHGYRDETLAMRLGSGTHALLFETPKVVVYRGGKFPDPKTGKLKDYSSVRNGACWEAFEKEHAKDCILSEGELAKAEAMARAIQTDMDADALLFAAGAKHEYRIEWTMHGRRCAGTLDALTPHAIPDLKATQDAHPKHFARQAWRMHWPVQATWYADGAVAAGLGWRHPYLVAVESAPPWTVTVWRLSDAAIDYSRRLYGAWFAKLLRCEAENLWPGPAAGVLELDVPPYLNPCPADDAVAA